MKKTKIFLSALMLLAISVFSKASTDLKFKSSIKDPVIIEVVTKYTSVEDALLAAKSALLSQKFISSAGIQQNTFTATRTTGSKADYYVADVTATKVDGKIKLTISFVKIGTGLLKVQKMADAVKAELEK
jgi:hypothetical protein